MARRRQFSRYETETEAGRRMELVEFDLIRTRPPWARRHRVNAWILGEPFMREIYLDQSPIDPALWFVYEVLPDGEKVSYTWPGGRPVRGFRRALAVARREAGREDTWGRVSLNAAMPLTDKFLKKSEYDQTFLKT